MILVLKENVTLTAVDELVAKLEWMDLHGVATTDHGRYSIAIVNGEDAQTDFSKFSVLPHVENIVPFKHKFKLASLEFKKDRSVFNINGHTIGGDQLTVIAGPCSIESEEQIHQTAALVAAAGANVLRGGAFKPRTSPYEFQGLGKAGLIYMQKAAKQHHLLCVTEVMDPNDIDLVASYVDILQIGSRNMQNFSLLKQVGKAGKPVLLKRGFSSTYMDFLMAAEYILQTGNPNVILCERGIRTFESYARNTLDLAAVPILRELTHLPVIIDPSHGTGIRNAVPPMACAAVAAGCDGIMVEVHPDPDKSLSDAKQTISPQTFTELMKKLRLIGQVVNMQVA